LISPETPAGMGALFKVLIQHRGLNPLALTGLKYVHNAV